MEGFLRGQIPVEHPRPGSLEIDRVDEKENRVPVDPVDDLRDLVVCLVGDPIVDRRWSVGAREIDDRESPRRSSVALRRRNSSLNATPCRAHRELATESLTIRIESFICRDENRIGCVDRLDVDAGEPERSGHRVTGSTRCAIHRHREGEADARGGDEDIRSGLRPDELLVQVDAE